MKIVGLISGGKDSLYNMLQCIAAGHEIVAVANVEPAEKEEELDSYMYQTVGHHAISLVSAAMSLPIFRQRTKGKALCKEKIYVETVGDEVEDLFVLLSKVKGEMHIGGVSVGAIESDYQRTRVENVCMRLNLQCFAYMWKRSQEELLQEMIEAEIHAVIVKVAAIGLKPDKHLGQSITDLQPVLVNLNKKFGVHICGEGGEYETLTLDCPLYNRKIDIVESEKVIHSDDAFAPVGYLIIRKATLESKQSREQMTGLGRLDFIKSRVKSPIYYIHDCLDEVTTNLPPEEQVVQARSAPEVLPFPFDSSSLEAVNESKAEIPESWKSRSSEISASNRSTPHSSVTAQFVPTSASNVDTAVTQINISTGWCCVGNVTAPNIKDGLSVVRKHLQRNLYEMRHIVSITLYVNDMKEFQKMNKVYSQILPKQCPPVRACVAVPLPHNVSVVITAVAHRILSKAQRVVHYTQNTVDRDYIHVQSISNWAPANIGPYSQCVRVGEIVYVAGQIPLIPGTMELLGGSIPQQCRLALRHALRIITAMKETYTMSSVMHGICFVVKEQVAAEVLDVWSCFTKNEHAALTSVVVTSLPKNADLEWQVLACGYSNPRVTTSSENVSEEVAVKWKRCLYVENTTSALVCNVSYLKQHSKKDKSIRFFSSDDLIGILKQCLQILRGDIDGSGTLLCMFNVFYKTSERAAVHAVNDILKYSLDFKVVVSCIPVVACSEPNVFITITGVCH